MLSHSDQYLLHLVEAPPEHSGLVRRFPLVNDRTVIGREDADMWVTCTGLVKGLEDMSFSGASVDRVWCR